MRLGISEFREHLELNAAVGITDLNKAVPVRKPGRKVSYHPEAHVPEHLHPESCGCWQCEGYTSYEEYEAAQ